MRLAEDSGDPDAELDSIHAGTCRCAAPQFLAERVAIARRAVELGEIAAQPLAACGGHIHVAGVEVCLCQVECEYGALVDGGMFAHGQGQCGEFDGLVVGQGPDGRAGGAARPVGAFRWGVRAVGAAPVAGDAAVVRVLARGQGLCAAAVQAGADRRRQIVVHASRTRACVNDSSPPGPTSSTPCATASSSSMATSAGFVAADGGEQGRVDPLAQHAGRVEQCPALLAEPVEPGQDQPAQFGMAVTAVVSPPVSAMRSNSILTYSGFPPCCW